ncbi:glucokinase [Mumia flava]|uniref:Glucokinase n=1 Tax=Mumia flava TaxID=1348852 RepID=A0A2M9BDM4_9ACTN|nr:ROK family glucokinase [Mumia flava]PJJ56056.1 glucokinase [Mumia flava]
MSARPAIGVDVGGTRVKAGVVDADGRVVERTEVDTPPLGTPEVLDVIGEVVETLAAGLPRSTRVGIGAAGFVDATRSTVLFAPHLPWRHEPLRDAVTRRTGRRVLVDNDANCAAWAEWRFGAAQNEPDLVCLTLGTGIGGAIVVDGRLHRGRWGVAGEFGHMQVVPDGRPCECGNRGCLEQYASGNALAYAARRAVADDLPLGRRLVEAAAPAAPGGATVGRLAAEGDADAVEVLAEVGRWLGVGLASLAAALDPGVFVVGGGVSVAGDLLLEPARETLRRTLTGRGYRPDARVVRAHLGNDAGLVGAADLARTRRRPVRSRRPTR